jgi:hypothetical protein
MLKNWVIWTKIGALLVVLTLSSIAFGQAAPTASIGTTQVGFGFSYAHPDFWTSSVGDPQYANSGISGVTAYADYDFGPHLSAEADFHSISLITSLDRAETTFMVGPRLMLPYGHLNFYGKALIGIGDLTIQEWEDNVGLQSGSGIVYSYGAGLDIQCSQHIVIRAVDFENQKWNFYGAGISPTVLTFGAAYRF